MIRLQVNDQEHELAVAKAGWDKRQQPAIFAVSQWPSLFAVTSPR